MKFLYYILLLFVATSCEVRYSMVDSSIDADTFSVEIFEEQAANAPAGYGITFTEFLRDFIVSRTKLKLVKENADIEISGKISSYYTNPVSIQSDEVAAQNSLNVGMDISVINNIDEKQSFERKFSQFLNYDSSLDLATVEDQLLEEINEQLALKIVNQLSSNW
ncbi:MAG: hypothetical protein HUJ25_10775 [Crocinitomicaceae bacterium]|nr:hypothetical protein [Crocinitomicaceae bacterium]